MADNLDRKLRLPRIHFRVLLHATNMRHGTNGFTSLPKEGVLRIFSPWKIRRLRPGLNPRTWVPKNGGVITTRFVEVVPSTTSSSPSSFIRIIRRSIFYVVNHMNMNMNETSVETFRMASFFCLPTEHGSFSTLYQECYPATFVHRHSGQSGYEFLTTLLHV